MQDQATRLISGVILFVNKLVNESTVDKKSCWGDRVKVFWQNNAWVDNLVMRDLARRFYEHKVAVHGEDVWVILFCDNLSAHLDEKVKNIIGERKLFLSFLPPNMTNFLQPIDYILSRSVRISVGRHLDEFLMNHDNMSR